MRITFKSTIFANAGSIRNKILNLNALIVKVSIRLFNSFIKKSRISLKGQLKRDEGFKPFILKATNINYKIIKVYYKIS